MRPFIPAAERSALPRWQSLVCFCLALFLLYNPYMAAPGSTNGLNVRHPASNRATVGVSELQHFSPADGKDKLSTAAIVSIEPFFSFAALSCQGCELLSQVVSPAQQFFGSSLWFRPPPAL
jgi:hypothetical protein